MVLSVLREKEKDDKHGPGSTAMNRQFAAAVFSTFGGVRGAEFIKIITALFHDSITADRRAGGTGWAAAQRKVRAREAIAATLVRGSARMASLLPLGEENPQPPRRPRSGAAHRPRAHEFY